MLLELVMIVKNAGCDFEQVLRDVQPFIDEWTILDTGSDDGTVDTINRVMVDKPGSLYIEEFVDFSTSRNRALDLSSRKCKYQIMMDDTYVFTDGNAFRKELAKKKDVNALEVYIEGPSQEYFSLRLIRTESGLRYTGKIHESIDAGNADVGEISSSIIDRTSKYMEGRTRSREYMSKQLMLDHLCENPQDRRIRTHLVRNLLSKCVDESSRDELRDHIDRIVSAKIRDAYDLECRLARVQRDCLDNDGMWNKKLYLALCMIDNDYPSDARVQYMLCLCSRQVGTKTKAFEHIWKTLTCHPKASKGSYINPALFKVEIPYQMADLALQTNKSSIAESVLKANFPSNGDNRLFNIILSSTNYPQPKGVTLGPAEVVVFHATGTAKGWAPNRYRVSGKSHASGSEIMLAEVAKQLGICGYRVIVFGSFRGDGYNTEDIYDGVQYIDESQYAEFILKYKVDHLIVSRDINNIIYANNVRNVYLWVHDVLPLSSSGSALESIQVHPEKFQRCLVLCGWHKKKVLESTSIPSDTIYITRNAICVDKIPRRDIESLRPRFIYASSVDRGLEHTIKCFNLIYDRFPDATLDIYADVSRESHNYKGNMKEICDLCSSPGVNVVGRTEHDEVLKRLCEYDIWLYPTDFYETYCITAVECQAAGLLCVTTSFGSLGEIVGDRGYVCTDKDPVSFIQKMSEYTIAALADPRSTNQVRESACDWGRSQDFSSLVADWSRNVLTSRIRS